MSSCIRFKTKVFQKQRPGQHIPLQYSSVPVLMNKALCALFVPSHGLKRFPFSPLKNNPINKTTSDSYLKDGTQ